MTRILTTLVLSLGLLTTSVAVAKEEPAKDTKKSAEQQRILDCDEVTLADLSKEMKADKDLHIFDANGQGVRDRYGVIPGATLLMKTFDPAKVLPEDKAAKLVFYCGGIRCMAAPRAAIKALDDGYKNVRVLKVGISGWVDAGKKTDKI